jgi:hypothetical protein
MCTVETKNYPISTITPVIQRYASVKKKFSATEIANCLSCYAVVTLHKQNGANVKLTSTNFKDVLVTYNNEIAAQELRSSMKKEKENNAKAFEEMKKEEVKEEKVEETVEEPIVEEEVEQLQADPEDPDIKDFSYIDSEE